MSRRCILEHLHGHGGRLVPDDEQKNLFFNFFCGAMAPQHKNETAAHARNRCAACEPPTSNVHLVTARTLLINLLIKVANPMAGQSCLLLSLRFINREGMLKTHCFK